MACKQHLHVSLLELFSGILKIEYPEFVKNVISSRICNASNDEKLFKESLILSVYIFNTIFP